MDRRSKKEQALDIILADDHEPTCKYLAELISQKTNWHILGEVHSGREAVDLAQEKPPDVVIMDVRMPEMNGVEATRRIMEMYPRTSVIMLSNCTDSIIVQAAIRAGAKAYVAKQRAGEELIPGICAMAEGDQYIGSLITL